MTIPQKSPSLYLPDGTGVDRSVEWTTHLGIGAHQDDLEFMALHGILQCYRQQENWFGGITVTDGGGSSRSGSYQRCSDADLSEIRKKEQNQAAEIGQYSFMAQLGYKSDDIKGPASGELTDTLTRWLLRARPRVVYTHNPADKHDTHLAVMAAVIQALRAMPEADRPEQVLGCEVWRLTRDVDEALSKYM